MRVLLVSALCLALAACSAHAASSQESAAACSKGDAPCFCKQIGGEWRALKTPLLPACKVSYTHQGAERYVHVYLPPSYDGTTQFPIWVHLHGVFWATMGDIGRRAGQPVNGTDIIPSFDHSVELLGDKAIIVYPQSTGEAGSGDPGEGQGKSYRQFWHIPFWRCSVGICRDPSIDDIGFIEKVLVDLPKRLPLKPGHYLLTGESAGGMMVHALLCQSEVVPATVDAAVDILGGIGADYMTGPKCSSSPSIPFFKLHGMEDPFITYSKQILVDGVNFASSIEGVQMRAKQNGCGPGDAGPKDVPEAGGKMLCTDFCGAAAGAKPPAKLCGMPTVGHDTDFPHPGFVYQQSWAWFEALTKNGTTATRSSTRKAAAAGTSSGGSRRTRRRSGTAAGPLVLNITYPGADVADFKAGSKGQAALEAVAAATGLPARNITATYRSSVASSSSSGSSTGGRRRRAVFRRALSAAAAVAGSDGVTGSYSLTAGEPRSVIRALASAIKDGSLLTSLQQKGLTAPGAASSPTLILGRGPTAGSSSSSSSSADQAKPLIGTTDLAAAAAGRATAADDAAVAAAALAVAPEETSDSGSNEPSSLTEGPPPGPEAQNQQAQPAGRSGPNTGAIVGGVVGGVGGAVLLAGLGVWAASAARKRKQQEQQQQWQEQQARKEAQQQQELPQQKRGVINLTADAAIVIDDRSQRNGGI